MAETNETQFQLHLLGTLLKPSYMSSTTVLIITLGTVVTAAISKIYWSGGWLADAFQTIATSNGQLFKNSVGNGDSPFNGVLLFLFWAFVGLMVYFFVVGVAHAIQEARELHEEIGAVNSNRRTILRTFVERLGIRLVALTMLFVTMSLYFKSLLPYAITSIRTVSADVWQVASVCLAVIGLVAAGHLITILLRAVALRPRLFTSEI